MSSDGNRTDRSLLACIRVGLSENEEATLKRILAHGTVDGVIITNQQGQPQYTTLDNNLTYALSSKLLSFAAMADSIVRDIDPTDSLITVRLRTREKEMMIATAPEGINVIAIQRMSSPLAQGHPVNDYNDSY